jgi:hypothetical protein
VKQVWFVIMNVSVVNRLVRMPAIRFKSRLYSIGSWVILRLPKDVSAGLPSRGQVMVKGTINDSPFQAVLEPDGDSSHWLHVDKTLQKLTGVRTGEVVTAALEPTKTWLEPMLPTDVQAALEADPAAKRLWTSVTPMARWEWIRWINSTQQAETRKRRIEVACSKLRAGERRPCCFNRNMCCVPEVSKSGVLLGPADR